MSEMWMPGLIHDPGKFGDYLRIDGRAVRNRMSQFKVHKTAGWNSYGVCKNNGLTNHLIPFEGTPWQFAPADALCYDSGPYNSDGPSYEIESGPVALDDNGRHVYIRDGLSLFQAEMTNSQLEWMGKISRWYNEEHGIPLTHYTGPRFQAQWFEGFVNHGDLDDQRSDGVTEEEWSAAMGSGTVAEPPKPKRKDNKMWCAWLIYINWVDVYYNGVIVESFPNEGGTEKNFGVGPRMAALGNEGIHITPFHNRDDYEAKGAARELVIASSK